MTPQQGIVLYYLAAIIVAFLLLNLPYVVKPGVNIEPVDTLFVAVSGVSVTGLTPVVIGETFTTFGQAVILDRKSTRLNSSHVSISYAVFCLKKKKINL